MKTIPSNDRTTLIIDSFEEILDDAIQYHRDSVSEETFRECMVCGEWDSHIKECPIQAIELWIKIIEKKDAEFKLNNV